MWVTLALALQYYWRLNVMVQLDSTYMASYYCIIVTFDLTLSVPWRNKAFNVWLILILTFQGPLSMMCSQTPHIWFAIVVLNSNNLSGLIYAIHMYKRLKSERPWIWPFKVSRLTNGNYNAVIELPIYGLLLMSNTKLYVYFSSFSCHRHNWPWMTLKGQGRFWRFRSRKGAELGLLLYLNTKIGNHNWGVQWHHSHLNLHDPEKSKSMSLDFVGLYFAKAPS